MRSGHGYTKSAAQFFLVDEVGRLGQFQNAPNGCRRAAIRTCGCYEFRSGCWVVQATQRIFQFLRGWIVRCRHLRPREVGSVHARVTRPAVLHPNSRAPGSARSWAHLDGALRVRCVPKSFGFRHLRMPTIVDSRRSFRSVPERVVFGTGDWSHRPGRPLLLPRQRRDSGGTGRHCRRAARNLPSI